MDQYLVTAISARLAAGVLRLTPAQSAPRLHNLKALGRGRFEIVSPVEFKRGEIIGYEGELPKALADVLENEQKAAGKKAKTKAATKTEDGAASGGAQE